MLACGSIAHAAVFEGISVRSHALLHGVCDTTDRDTLLLGFACRRAA